MKRSWKIVGLVLGALLLNASPAFARPQERLSPLFA